MNMPDKYISLMDVLVGSIAEYFHELCRKLSQDICTLFTPYLYSTLCCVMIINVLCQTISFHDKFF